MVRKQNARARRGVTSAVLFVLQHGVWFFGRGFDWADWPVDHLRELWQQEPVRAEVREEYKARHHPGRPWADCAFGEDGRAGSCWTEADLKASRLEHHLEREAETEVERQARDAKLQAAMAEIDMRRSGMVPEPQQTD